jgi:hypothetical protein
MGEILDPDAAMEQIEEAEALQQAHMQLVQDMMAEHGEGSEAFGSDGSVDGHMDGGGLDSGDEVDEGGYGEGEGVNYLEAMVVQGEEGEEGSGGLGSVAAAAAENAEHADQQQQEQQGVGTPGSDNTPAAAGGAAGGKGVIPTPRAAAPFPPCTPHPILPAHAPEVSTALGWYPSHNQQQQQQQQQRGSLAVGLQLPRLAQLVCVKLLDSEDVSPAFNDSRGGCNIDCEVVMVRGQDLGGLVGQRGMQLLGAACRG